MEVDGALQLTSSTSYSEVYESITVVGFMRALLQWGL